MAKIRCHGRIVGTLHFTRHSKRYMSDGKILVNQGFGWKLRGAVKSELAHLTPAELYERERLHQEDWKRRHPAGAAFQKALHAEAGLSRRWKLFTAIEMMPDDPDGVWSECCDGYGDNVHADLDDIVTLCRLYKAAESEAKMLRQMRASGELKPEYA